MDFKSHFEQAWQLMLKNIVPLILMTLVFIVVSVFSLGILGPVTFAGYLYAIMLLLRENREPKIQDLFSQMKLFLPLLGFGIAGAIAFAIGFALLVLPGLILLIAIAFFALYMIPFMIDEQLGLIEALKKSIAMVKGNMPEHAIVLIISIGLTWVGSLVVVGSLFTLPLASIFLMSVYLKSKI